jgi:hypothetical protein
MRRNQDPVFLIKCLTCSLSDGIKTDNHIEEMKLISYREESRMGAR